MANVVLEKNDNVGVVDEADLNSEFLPSLLRAEELKLMLKRPCVLGYVEGKYGRFNPDDIIGFEEVWELDNKGPVHRSDRLDVYRLKGNRPIPLELLSKVMVRDEEYVDTSNRLHKDLSESVRFEYEQMRFWNAINLPAPLVIGHKIRIEDGRECHHLVMEFLGRGPTHDMNILALEEVRSALRTSAVSPEDTHNYNEMIDREIDTIIRSGIGAIAAFHLRGTRQIRKPEHKSFFDTLKPVDVERYYLEDRGVHYLNMLLQFLYRPDLNGVNREKIEKEFRGVFRKLLAPFHKKEMLCYAHGDEYLHHMQFLGEDGTRESGIFDADHVIFTRPEYSFAKLLTSYLLRLSLRDEMDYLAYAFSQQDDKSGYNRELFTEDRVINDYITISVVGRFLDMGKRASDRVLNWEVEEGNRLRGLPYIQTRSAKFPIPRHIPSSVYYPSVEEAIEVQKMELDGRFTTIEDNAYRLNVAERAAILQFRDFLHKIHLYE